MHPSRSHKLSRARLPVTEKTAGSFAAAEKTFDAQRTRDEISLPDPQSVDLLTALPFCYAPYSRAARSNAIGPRSNARPGQVRSVEKRTMSKSQERVVTRAGKGGVFIRTES